MRASNQTQLMVRWWRESGIGRVDLAVKRSAGAMLWHYDIPLSSLIPGSPLLAWARAENVRAAEVYARPARGSSWPLVFLDDLPAGIAVRAAQKYDALVIRTSEEGGCHLWLTCTRALGEEARHQAQRWLARRSGADPASTSGEHLGRLAGFKNWKRGGTWVNVIDASRRGRCWTPVLENDCSRHATSRPPCGSRPTDTSESGQEWGWVCSLLEAGCDPHIAYHRLIERARPRRGNDAERYARRTVKRAADQVNARQRTT